MSLSYQSGFGNEFATEALPGAWLWLVDPHGNLVLRYPAGSRGKAILDDLRYLLKISQIG